MKRITWLAAVVAGVFLVESGAAQSRPDFSGRWTTTPEQQAGRQVGPGTGAARGQAGVARGRGRGRGRGRARMGDMGSGWGTTITVTQDASQLTVQYVFFSRGDLQPPLKYVYALDGSETTNSIMMGNGAQDEKARTSWDGDTLVITTEHSFTHPETSEAVPSQVVRRLSLDSPTTMVVEVTRSGVLGGEPDTTRTMYRRVE